MKFISMITSRLILPILLFTFLFSASRVAAAGPFDYPTAELGTKWINNQSGAPHSVQFMDGSKVQAVLLRGSLGPRFATGFYCTASSCATSKFLFGVFIVITNSASGIVMPAMGFPQPVWSPNRHHPVSLGATLELTRDGNLVLRDADQKLVWESGSSAAGVQRMSLDDTGNLILHSAAGKVVWQSFDHPADVMVPGQVLKSGGKLSASDAGKGSFFLGMEDQGLGLYVSSSPKPQPYWTRTVEPGKSSSFARYTNGSLDLFVTSPTTPDVSIRLPTIQSAQYLKISPDGRLLVFTWDDHRGWIQLVDVLQYEERSFSKCNLPSACGRFGVCTDDGECSCPRSFSAVDALRPSKGCVPPKPYRCSVRSNRFVEVPGVDYFANDFASGIWGKTLPQCRELCGSDCSCRAAFYRNGEKAPDKNVGGICYQVTDVFTLRNSYRGPGYSSVGYVKV